MDTKAFPVDRTALKIALQVGMLAPSIHNTQPWRFELGLDHIGVFADRSRWLPATDASSRELHLSCGAALRYIRAALAQQGLHASVALLPNANDPHHLARIYVDGVHDVTSADHHLLQAIFLRHTDRGRYEDRAMPPELVAELVGGVREYAAVLTPIISAYDRTLAADALKHADDISTQDPNYVRELASWVRSDNGAEDGIIPRSLAPESAVRESSIFKQRDFTLGSAPATPEREFVAVLSTQGDDPYSWLMAGQALGWLFARAAQDQVTGQPMSQVIEIAGARERLRSALRLGGYPQMLLRLGYGKGGPVSHRRRLDAVLSPGTELHTHVMESPDLGLLDVP